MTTIATLVGMLQVPLTCGAIGCRALVWNITIADSDNAQLSSAYFSTRNFLISPRTVSGSVFCLPECIA
jgi:hypothetical protein